MILTEDLYRVELLTDMVFIKWTDYIYNRDIIRLDTFYHFTISFVPSVLGFSTKYARLGPKVPLIQQFKEGFIYLDVNGFKFTIELLTLETKSTAPYY